MSVIIPHFQAPFRFNTKGVVQVSEQGSVEEIAQCVLNIASCIEGFREDLPEFGIPDVSFETIPLNLESIQQSLNRWEPRAELTLEEVEELLNPGSRGITVEVT